MSNEQQTESGQGFTEAKNRRAAVIVLTYLCVYGLLAVGSQFVGSISLYCLIFFVYWGWKALDMITPNVFLVMPLVGWVVYYGFKYIAAILVGAVIGPYKLGCFLVNKIEARRLAG